jgi:hypothetical protein
VQPGEEQMAAYARQHGLDGADDQEPDLGGGAGAPRPDFRLSRGDSTAIVEVKEYERSVLDDRMKDGGYFTLGDKDEYGQTRDKIKDARRQLKPYVFRGEALIVGLANPKRLWLSVTDPKMLLMAMEGNPTVTMPIDIGTGSPAGEIEHVYGRDGPLGNEDHPYISGVVFVQQRTDDEGKDIEDYFVVVCESKRVFEGTAEAIPRDLFTGRRDELWSYDPASRLYVREYGPD